MNIFKKIKIFNKITKAIKEIKAYLDTTHIDYELKEIINSIKENIEKLIKKFPELKELYLEILEILK